MQITKFGHSCVLLDDGVTKILFDPGSYSTVPDVKVNAVAITHAHPDHLDVEKLQKLLQANPALRIITNTEVKNELDQHGVSCEVVEQNQTTKIGELELAGMGNDHAIIHPSLPVAQNTAYLVNNKILHPGDALYVPTQSVEVLLLPVVAPWSKISETLDYITAVKPKVVFPIHDGFLKTPGVFHRLVSQWTENLDAKFIAPEDNKAYQL